MKKRNIRTSGVTIFVFKCQYMWSSNSLLRKYNQFGNPTLSFAHFSEVFKRILIIKYFVG